MVGSQQAYIEIHFCADTWRSFFTVRTVRNWKRLHGEVVLPACLEASKIQLDKASSCSDFIAGTTLNRMLAWRSPEFSCQHEFSYDSVILYY